jgi:hypothetical protein
MAQFHETQEEKYRNKISELEKLKDVVRCQEEELLKHAEKEHFEEDLQVRINVRIALFKVNMKKPLICDTGSRRRES